MTSLPVEVWVPITEQKPKQTVIDNRPKPMSSPIINPTYTGPMKFTYGAPLLGWRTSSSKKAC